MTDDTAPATDTVPAVTPDAPAKAEAEPAGGEPRLQREAVVLVHDRGRFAVLVALCTLAGVAVGFVLGAFASDRNAAYGDAGAAMLSAYPGADEPDDTSCPAAPHPPAVIRPRHVPDPGVNLWRPDIDILSIDSYAWLGVRLDDDNGARVTEVIAGSPAAAAGLQDGDIVTTVDGESIAKASQLQRAIRDREPGDDVSITVLRNGDDITLSAELGSRGGGQRVRIR